MTKKISAWAMFVRAFMLSLFAGSAGGAQAQNGAMTDDAAWSYAVSIGTATALREYLRSFPTGAHIDEAIALLIALGELDMATAAPGVRALAIPAGGASSTGIASPY